MFIVILTSDLYPWKSSGSILLSSVTIVCQVWWKYTEKFDLYHVHKVIFIYDYCDLELLPLTSKIDRGHPLIMGNIWIMSNENMLMVLIWIMFIRSFPYIFCICSLWSWHLTSYLQNQLRTLRSCFCQVSLNSIQWLQRSRKCLSRSKAGRAIFVFR